LIRRFRLPLDQQRQVVPMLIGHFVAPVTGTYRIAVAAQRVAAGETSTVSLNLDNSIIGIRGVASPETDLFITNTPEV
jgi:hypothetical protein